MSRLRPSVRRGRSGVAAWIARQDGRAIRFSHQIGHSVRFHHQFVCLSARDNGI